MEEKKLSEKNGAAVCETEQAAAHLPPAVIEEELKMLPDNFTGTIEIPLSVPSAADTADRPGDQKLSDVLPGAKGLTDEDFTDFENLLWNGSMPDLPVVNYGDEYVVTEGEKLAEGKKQASIDEIIKAVRKVEDPEIMMNVYDLGLIYRMDKLADGDVEIDMTVTAPSCPVAGLMPKQVAEAVGALEGVGKVTVKLVWEPAWSVDRMSENARYILDMF